MDYIVFDLEWNQPANESVLVTDPVYLDGEIIEIGAVKLNSEFRAVDELKLYIKPQYYTKMHHRIASLTGISDKTLEQEGLPFPKACEEFLSWCGEDFGFVTWSDSDLPELIDNMLLHGMDVSHLPPCFDAQRMFDREIMREDHQYSLDAALEVLGVQGDKAHDALHDARNTVKVCDHLELEEYMDEYATRPYTEQPSLRVYESISQILEDSEAKTFVCPWCGEKIIFDGWVPLKGHRYAAMGTCPEEDEYLMYVSCLPWPQGGWRISRLVYDMSDDLWEQYQDQLEAQQVN